MAVVETGKPLASGIGESPLKEDGVGGERLFNFVTSQRHGVVFVLALRLGWVWLLEAAVLSSFRSESDLHVKHDCRRTAIG